jgi:hypothetical protein
MEGLVAMLPKRSKVMAAGCRAVELGSEKKTRAEVAIISHHEKSDI